MLHPVTGGKQEVLTAIKNAADAFTQNNAVVQQKMREAFPDDAKREQVRQHHRRHPSAE